MPFVSTTSGAWPVSRFCSQISWPGTFRVQLPVGATSSCAKPVAVLASSCSRAPVVAVFLITKPVVEAEAELVTLSTLVRHWVSSASIFSISLVDASKTLVPVVPPCRLRNTCPKSAIRVGVRTWVVALATPATARPAPSTVTPLVPPLIVSRSSPILADTALVRSPVAGPLTSSMVSW